ncbi:ornithine carbamoyltransferase 1 [Auricularia subglabra TFB-10046 SS5]|nr:ornithine carbamoyltransferase 1 [Auricularia subglabra TFB-10046 SS5]
MAAPAAAAATGSLRRHFMTLADLNTERLRDLLASAQEVKRLRKAGTATRNLARRTPLDTVLSQKAIAFVFNKRSTRTRIAGEIAVRRLGGIPLFLGQDDIQLGANESLVDTARVLGGLTNGIFARVGKHSDIETIASETVVPVINALSDLWHPTQVLADLMTLSEVAHRWEIPQGEEPRMELGKHWCKPLTVAYVGDSANVLHDMLVSYPRLGAKLRVATPPGPKYQCPKPVWDRVTALGCDKNILWTNDPKEAVHGADVVVTDTWISMGQEAEKEERLQAFKGFQVTEQLCKEGGAKEDWLFMHCLPRKAQEVDDEVFYGPRSVVFHEANNRLPTIEAVFL